MISSQTHFTWFVWSKSSSFFQKMAALAKKLFFSEFVIFLLFWRKDLFNAFCWFFSVVWHRKRATVNSFANADFFLFRLFFFQFLDQKRNLLFFSLPSFQETLILMLETSKTIVVSIDQTALKISLQGVSNLGNEGVGLDSFVNKAYYCYDVIREGIKAYLISHGQSSKSFLRNGIPRYIHGRGIHLETTKFSRWYENVSYNWCFFQNRKSGIGNQSDHS